ncbi:MAG: hypothetical protein SOZ48_06550 [Eubacterium sp.]|nr:hypothetical protein [Eubacterium sp.]
MIGADVDNSKEKEDCGNIKRNGTQQKKINETLKRGIYKELHKRGVLSDAQLNILLERNC